MKSILFLCTGNSCRSQMAEGLCRAHWSKQYQCFSAGTQKHGMNQRAITVMGELGLDLSSHYSKTLSELPVKEFDFVVTVCDSAKEACPYFPGGKTIHIGFEDPPKLTLNMNSEEKIMAIYRRVRDEIQLVIKDLPRLLGDLK